MRVGQRRSFSILYSLRQSEEVISRSSFSTFADGINITFVIGNYTCAVFSFTNSFYPDRNSISSTKFLEDSSHEQIANLIRLSSRSDQACAKSGVLEVYFTIRDISMNQRNEVKKFKIFGDIYFSTAMLASYNSRRFFAYKRFILI